MSRESHGPRSYLAELRHHLLSYTDEERERIASLYGVEEATSDALIDRWLSGPEVLLEVLDEELDRKGWAILQALACEHDLRFERPWGDVGGRDELRRLGLVRVDPEAPEVFEVPGAIAAMLAPRLPASRPTLPILLSRAEPSRVEELARLLGVETEARHLANVLAVAEAMREPGALDLLLEELPDLDWLGPAMMVLELGGACYWQEVFGYELEGGGVKVVPLMSREDRSFQRDVAEALVELGLLFRVEEPDVEYAFAAVPEAFWHDLWRLRQDWLLDWVLMCVEDLADSAVGGAAEPLVEALAATKWLAVEAAAGRVQTRDLCPTQTCLDYLVAHTDVPERVWAPLVSMGVELDMFEEGPRGALRLGQGARDYLDQPSPPWVWDVLQGWVIGAVGGLCDVHLGRALGVDEAWRRALLEVLSVDEGVVPAWLLEEGVPHEETGAGCLREVETSDEEMVLFELGLTTSIVCVSKLRFLDVLSVLEPGRWYSVTGLVELLRFVASYSVMDHFSEIIGDPGAAVYVPLQRPSLYDLASHEDAFMAWLEDVARELWEPLGVARVDAERGRVWLDTQRLRVPSSQMWPDEYREGFVRELFGDPTLDFELSEPDELNLRPVLRQVEGAAGLSASDAALTELLEAFGDAEATEFVGGRVNRRD